MVYAIDRSKCGSKSWCDSYFLCLCVVFTTRHFILCLILLCGLMYFSVLLSFVITSLGEERAGLYASRASICLLFCLLLLLLGRCSAADCDCGTLWTFH